MTECRAPDERDLTHRKLARFVLWQVPETSDWRLHMISWVKLLPTLAAGLGSAALLCPLCARGPALARAESVREQSADTATVQLRISRMTCGSCLATARLALKKLAGVYSATVTLDDSLGVVRYDPDLVTPQQIAAHLTRATGFPATILAEASSRPRRSESD